MRINLNQLNVFYLAARHKSMTATAKLLYVSKPAVTMQIKKLEAWLGFPVFERGQGELRLTEPGRALYGAVAPVFSQMDKLEQYVQDMVQTGEVEFKLGTHHLPGNYFISDLIAHVQAKYPNIKVLLELGPQDGLLEKLAEQKLDMAVMIGEPPPGAPYKGVHLFDEPLVLVTAAKGPLGKTGPVSVKDIAAIPLILQQRGTGALRVVLNFLAGHNVAPQVLLENISSDVIKHFLLKMHAAAFIGWFIVKKELDEGVLHEIKLLETPPVSRFHLAYLDSPYLPARITQFIDGVADFSPDFRKRP